MLAAGDVVSVPGVSATHFSSSVADDAGGIAVNVASGGVPYDTYDVVVTDPNDGGAATCAGCLQLLVRGSDGVRRYDVATRTWRSLSGPFAQSLVAVTWSL